MDVIAFKKAANLRPAETPTGQTMDPEQDKKLKKTCSDFESLLVYQLLKNMRQTIPKSGFMGSSHAQGTYEMMLDQKIADDLAKKGKGVGLQKMLYDQITRLNGKKD